MADTYHPLGVEFHGRNERMAIVASVRIVVVCLAVVFTSTAAPAQSTFETPPVLKAQDLAPAGLLLGPRYRVDDRRLAIFISGATAFISAAP